MVGSIDSDLLDGVLAQIRKTCDTDYKIYIDEGKQGIEAPCFFVRILSAQQIRLVRNRYRVIYNMGIEYHPADTNLCARDFAVVRPALMMALELVQVGDRGLQRGTNIHTENEDGVLHVFVDYDFHIFVDLPRRPNMEVLQQSQGLKGGPLYG